jgi:NAD(P)-dependent dehydrogenase (short-subunit alcohol dehydrogenase family)
VETLIGKRALVTGAGMGIGRGIALILAREGAAVAVHYAGSKAGADETVAEISRDGGNAVVIAGDLRTASVCATVVETAIDGLGGLDILVNNAGVTRDRPVLETDEAVYDTLFDLNMKGAFFCTQRAVAEMIHAGQGSVITITSVHGQAGFPNHAAYAATKGAIIAFTRALAVELAPQRIRVNAVGPGVIEVPRYFDVPGYTTAFGDTLVPWGRVGRPADVGEVVAFLASDAADFITGQTLFVDGGTTARMGLWWDQGGGDTPAT